MNLDALRALVAIAEEGTVQGAARRLGASRSTIRRRIAQLEEEAQVPLVIREGDGLILTSTGQGLARSGRRLIDQADTMLSELRQAREEPLDRIRIGVPLGIPAHLAPLLLRTARTLVPGRPVYVRAAEDPMSLIGEHADMVGHYGPHTPPGPWLSVLVYPFRAQLLASPDYLARAGHPTTPAELVKHTLLSWQSATFDPHRWPLTDGSTLVVRPQFAFNDPGMARRCAAAGAGIALVPDGNVSDPALPGLVSVLPEAVGAPTGLRLVVREALVDHSTVFRLFNALKAALRSNELFGPAV